MSSKLNVNYLGAATPGGDIKFTDPIGVATFTSLDFNVKSITVGTGATVYNPEDNVLCLGTNDTERLRIDENGRFALGNNAAVTTGKFQVFTRVTDAIDILAFDDVGEDAGRLSFFRNRSTSYTSNTKVAENDTLGRIDFRGMNTEGTDNYEVGASIRAAVDGEPGSGTDSNDMPGRLMFFTTPDGSHGTVERLRITCAGDVGIGTSAPQSDLHILDTIPRIILEDSDSGKYLTRWWQSGNATVFDIDSADTGGSPYFMFKVGGTEHIRINSSGHVGIGTDNPANDVHIMDGSATMKLTSTASATSTRLILESEADSYGGIHFGDPDDEDVGRIRYYHGGSNPNTLWFSTVAQVRVAINADGKLGIGTDGMGVDSLCSNGGVDICSRGGTGKPALVIGADNSHTQSQSRTNDQQKDTRIGMPHYSNSEECPCILSAFATANDTSIRLGGGTQYLNSATELRFYTDETNTTLSDADKYRVAIHKKGVYELRTGDNSTTSRGWRQAMAYKAWDTDGAEALFDLHMEGGHGTAHLIWEVRDASTSSTGGAGTRIGQAWVCFRGSGTSITHASVVTESKAVNNTGNVADITWSAAVQDTSTIRLTATPSVDSSSVGVYIWGSSPHFATDSYGIEAL